MISNNLKEDAISFRKAKILTYIHLFLIVVYSFLYISTYWVVSNNPVPILPTIFIAMLLIYCFKKFGNLILAGNLVAAVFAGALIPYIPETGGLYSDNLLWLIISPILALLFANKRSGFIWICFLMFYTFGLYYFQGNDSFSNIKNNEYYLISYSIFFLMIFGIVNIFEIGQSLIIQMLNEKKILLEQQKLAISLKNDELEAAQEQLKIKNGELENFAFAAAHDLKEPLRMIGMYTKLSKKRINGHLDKTTEEYFNYVTDGIDRMQKLLDDLLQYSLMSKTKDDIKDVDLNAIIFVVIHNMMATMKDSQACITINHLPIIEGANSEMMQLFQNLIANSIKFRKPTVVPEIIITATDEGDNYLISLNDNGIGIKKEFQERVFAIFERAHARHEYEGSGIGLATCKKIVESSGGKIWLRSNEGEGTTFYLSFPKPNLN